MKKTKVSVIIPIYNVEKYLRQCLESIIVQTLQDIEIICVNDGSTDASSKILQEYRFKDERIKIINKENTGYGNTMNVGIDAAKGEYIGIVESDDFIKPDMYENLYKLIVKNNCDFVKSDFYNYWTSPEKTLQHSRMGKYKLNEVISTKEDINILKITPSVWSSIYKKDFLDKNNIRFLETPGASYQDTSFHYKTFISAGRLLLTDKAYVYYRQDNENSSVKNKEKVYCICDEYNEIHKYIQKNEKLKDCEQFIYAQHFKAYYWNMARIAPKFRKEFYKCYQEEFKKYYDSGLLKEDFYKYLKKKLDFSLFINAPDKFYKKFEEKERKKKWNEFRRKLVSVRINSQRVSISVLDRQIIKIG